jgi:hypothetical protein
MQAPVSKSMPKQTYTAQSPRNQGTPVRKPAAHQSQRVFR